MQRAKQLRELRQGAQQAKYAKQQERILAEKVGASLNLCMPSVPEAGPALFMNAPPSLPVRG